MRVALESKADGALLDCLHCVLNLEEFSLGRPGYAVQIIESLQHLLSFV